MAKTPHFFKIILNDELIQQGNLVIPKSFLRGYGNHLLDKAFLKVPSGPKWQVDVVKTGRDVWFGNGWKHFADHYSVSYGTFLVFGLEDFKNCIFNVLIFDRTTSEIDYPFHVQEDDDNEPNVEEQVHQPDNEENSDMNVFPIQISSEDELESPSSSRPQKKKNKKQENNRTQSDQAKRGNRDRFAKRAQLKHKEMTSLKEFTSLNPYFIVKLQPSSIVNNLIEVPLKLMAKCVNRSMDKAKLQVENNVWPVKILSYPHRFKFSAGVCAFVHHNSLQVGDVCVFELIDSETLLLNVSIFRKS